MDGAKTTGYVSGKTIKVDSIPHIINENKLYIY